MGRCVLTTGLVVALLSAVACNKPAMREKPLPDPLLTSKKPIEGRVEAGPYTPTRDDLPPPPPMPTEGLPGANGDVSSVVRLLGIREAR